MNKILVIGMNPGSGGVVDRVPKHSALGRLQDWMTVLGHDYYSFVNVFAAAGNFKPSQVDTVYLSEVVRLHGDGPVVALGGVASSVLTKMGVEHHAMPHPSYRNRVFNDPTRERAELCGCAKYVENWTTRSRG